MFNHSSFNKGYFDRESQQTDISNIIISLYGHDSNILELDLFVPTYLPILIDGLGVVVEPNPIENYGLRLEIDVDPIDINGSSIFEILKIGNVDISFIHLENIELAPGESVTIDTDLLIILFGEVHDVSSITTDSIFFTLGKGENGLSIFAEYGIEIRPGGPDELEVALIWQNRWL